ncbi:MAG: choice-of-anchor I family protein [Gemmatimonadota bacterium]
MFSRTAVTLTVTLLGLAACTDVRTPLAGPGGTISARADASDPTPTTLQLRKIGGFDGGQTLAAEITAYDFVSKRLFVVNGALGSVDVLDLSDPTHPTLVATLSGEQFGGPVNSVAADRGLIAIAVEAVPKTAPGKVVFVRATTLDIVSQVAVGALPDMVTFSSSGKYLLVANEGEPNSSYTVDPEGSVSIIDVSNANTPSVRTATFTSYNGQAAALRAAGVRIYGPNATVAQDLEPEYITIDDAEHTAYVTLQENNAIAIVNLASATVTSVAPLGYKDHRLAGQGLDPSDRDTSNVRIRNWPVLGMYQPDAIASYTVNGQTYLITANEGDAREYLDAPGFVEEARVSTLSLNPAIFTTAACNGVPCRNAGALGRLTVTSTLGRNPSTGLYDALYVLGGRSVSIWTTNGTQVNQLWDSGDQFEQLTKAIPEALFNASNNNNGFDDRSDNKGPEPEGVVLGKMGTKTFAFIGLERIGGVAVYDVTTPAAPIYVTYLNTRSGGAAGDRGPEGVTFIPAVRSPNKRPLLIVGNETSGTTAIYQVDVK